MKYSMSYLGASFGRTVAGRPCNYALDLHNCMNDQVRRSLECMIMHVISLIALPHA